MKLDFINWVTEMHRKLIREIFPELASGKPHGHWLEARE
jgi:hypothetical protein